MYNPNQLYVTSIVIVNTELGYIIYELINK